MTWNSERGARGPNSITFTDYLSLLHDNNAVQQHATCPSSLLRRQFSRLRPQQTTDLLALGTNGSEHRGGLKVVFDIRFLLPPCSRPLTFQNKQIPSLGWKARLVKWGCDRLQWGLLMTQTHCICIPKGIHLALLMEYILLIFKTNAGSFGWIFSTLSFCNSHFLQSLSGCCRWGELWGLEKVLICLLRWSRYLFKCFGCVSEGERERRTGRVS